MLYPAAASPILAVPTPVVSEASTPVFDTRLVIDVYTGVFLVPVFPYPNIALSTPYPVAAS